MVDKEYIKLDLELEIEKLKLEIQKLEISIKELEIEMYEENSERENSEY